MSKATTADRLSATRAELEVTDRQIAELGSQRTVALLADDDRAAAKLFIELEKSRAAAAGYHDKIELLEQEQAREAEAEREREREARLRKFEEVATSPEALGTRLQEAAVNLEREFRLTIEAREAARAMFPYGASSHLDVAAISATGCALSAAAIAELLSYELFRVGKKLPSGVHGAPIPQSLPGPRAPSLSLLGQPEAIQPLSEKLRQASQFAVETLRSGRTAPPEQPKPAPAAAPTPAAIQPAAQAPPPPAPPAPVQPAIVLGTPHATKMRALIDQLQACANDISPAGVKRYDAIVAEIAALDGEMRNNMAVPAAA